MHSVIIITIIDNLLCLLQKCLYIFIRLHILYLKFHAIACLKSCQHLIF